MKTPEGVETIFAEALRLPPEERTAYVAQTTEGNADLKWAAVERVPHARS